MLGQEGRGGGLDAFNAMSVVRAHGALLGCCGSGRWAELVAVARPYESVAQLLGAADRAFDELDRDDWLQAFAAHSRIGVPRAGDARGAAEQAGAASATAEQREELVQLGGEYERRIGYIFLICASGLDARQLLDALRARIDNPPGVEFTIATGEQHKITMLRLRKLLGHEE